MPGTTATREELEFAWNALTFSLKFAQTGGGGGRSRSPSPVMLAGVSPGEAPKSSLRNKRPDLSGRPPCKDVAIGVATSLRSAFAAPVGVGIG